MEILIVVAPLLIIGGLFLFKVVKYGGVHAALYGAPVGRQLGELTLPRASGPVRVIRVRVLHGTDKQVGLEVAAKGPGSYSLLPIAFSRADARKLSEWLAQAASE